MEGVPGDGWQVDADGQHHGGHLAQGGEPTSALGHAGHGHQRHAVHDPHSRAMAASTHPPPSRRRFVDAWEFSTFKKRSACRDCDWQHDMLPPTPFWVRKNDLKNQKIMKIMKNIKISKILKMKHEKKKKQKRENVQKRKMKKMRRAGAQTQKKN